MTISFRKYVPHARQWSKVRIVRYRWKYYSRRWTATLRCPGRWRTYDRLPHTCASLTRKDKYLRLAIYLNSRYTRLSSAFYMSIARVSPFSSHLFFTTSAAHLIFYRAPLSYSLFFSPFFTPLLSFSLFLSFSLSHTLSLSLSLSVPSFLRLPSARRCGSSAGARGMLGAAGTIACDVDCQNLGEAPGEVVYR